MRNLLNQLTNAFKAQTLTPLQQEEIRKEIEIYQRKAVDNFIMLGFTKTNTELAYYSLQSELARQQIKCLKNKLIKSGFLRIDELENEARMKRIYYECLQNFTHE